MNKFLLTVILGLALAGFLTVVVISAAKPKEKPGILAIGKTSGQNSSADVPDRPEIQIKIKPLRKEVEYFNDLKSAEWELDAETFSGTLKGYYENGGVWLMAPIKNGMIHGTVQTYYENGNVWTEAEYYRGQEDGDMTIYYANGKPWLRWTMQDGKVRGMPLIYSENGIEQFPLTTKPPETGTGYFKAYDANGKVMSDWAYDGKGNTQIVKAYYENGTLSAEVSIAETKQLTGESHLYYTGGEKWLSAHFEDGRPANHRKYFYRDGRLWMDILAEDNGLTKATKIYYPRGPIWIAIRHDPAFSEIPPDLYPELALAASVSEA